MNILFLTDNFPPEGNAPASRTYEHAVQWVRAGHSVTVITGAPNFPEGKLFPGYKNRWYGVEDMDGIRVVRVKTYITANEGFAKRTLDYLSFMVTSFIAGLFQRRPDVIVGTSPQFFTVCSAWALSVFHRRPFVFELRDLWPASIKAVGVMKESRVIRALERLEMFLYHKSAAIVSVTNAFKSELVERGIDSNKISVVINGVDLSRYSPRAKDSELLKECGLEGKFVVGYIGTHGMAHALHRILEAADQIREHKDIAFLLVGSGAQREALLEQAASMSLDNVCFLPRQPKEKMAAVWSLCDVSLIQLKDDPLFRSVIPSKIFESMGMGLPILLSLPEGEASGIITQTGSGIVIPPEQPDKLAKAVLELSMETVLHKKLSKASADAAARYSREMQATKMLDVLEQVVAARKQKSPNCRNSGTTYEPDMRTKKK
jgi:glycosyltransferase involved in cell wall biosynthesis